MSNFVDDIKISGNSTGTYDIDGQIAKLEEEYQRKKKLEEEEFNLPLPQKLESKNWKCRRSAIDQISAQIKTMDVPDMEIIKLMPKLAQEPHQQNLELSLGIINQFLDKKFYLPNEISLFNDLCRFLIEKSYTQLKQTIKDESEKAIVKCIENMQSTEVLCEGLLKMLQNRTQKLIQGAIKISKTILSLFGPSGFNYKILLPQMVNLIDSSPPMIKNDIVDFLKELYMWIRGGIKQYIDNKVKDSTKIDLDKAFDEMCVKFKEGFVANPVKFLNSNSGNIIMSKKEKAIGQNSSVPINDVVMNCCDDCEVDVFNNKYGFGEKFVEEIIKPERKWKEKKEMFDQFANAISIEKVVKIKNTNRIFFTEMLKLMLKDPNVNVINSIIIGVGNMSRGLRGDFTEGREFFGILLEFFKEKKEKFSNDLMSTLEAIMIYLDDSVLCDLIVKYTEQSLPNQSKEKVCLLIEKIAKIKRNIQLLIDKVLIKYTDDPAIEIRTAAIKSLANIKMLKTNLKILLENEAKNKKMEEIITNALGAEQASIVMMPPKKQIKKKEQVEENAEVDINEIEQFMIVKLGEELCNNFNEAKWDIRRDAFKSLNDFICSNQNEVNTNLDYYVQYIQLKIKNFKENNINIIKESIIVLQSICQNCPVFAKKYSNSIIKKVIDKISDAKTKSLIQSLFNNLIQFHNEKSVITSIMRASEGKSVIILKEIALYICNAIETFGIDKFPIKEIVEFCKCLELNSNPNCRNSATTLLCEIYKYMGEPLKAFLKDLKEVTMKVIEEEFKKVKVVTTNQNPKGKNVTNMLIDNLFPKVDISKKITPKILKELSEGKWQMKKESIEAIEGILKDANMRILPNGLTEMFRVFKQTLKESNKAIVRSLIQLIIKLTDALGNNIKQYIKLLIVPLVKNLSDKNNILREDVLKCLSKFIDILGFAPIGSLLIPFLNEENFEMRTELLKLLNKYKAHLSKIDYIKDFIPGIISCLCDKIGSIRLAAEEYAKEMLKNININAFYIVLKDLKPTIADSVKLIIGKYSGLICGGDDNVIMSNIEMKDPNEMNVKGGVQKKNSFDLDNTFNFIPPIQKKTENNNNNFNNNNNNNIPYKQSNNNIFAKSFTDMKNMIQMNNNKICNNFEIENQVINFTMESTSKSNNNNQSNLNINCYNYQISKSPLMILKNRSKLDSFQKEASGTYFNISNLFEQSIISKLISKLYTADNNEKSASLIEISEMISIPNNKDIIQTNLRDIFIALNTLLSSSINSISINSDTNLLRYLLTSYFKLACRKEIISSPLVIIDTIYVVYEKLFLILSIPNENIERNPDGKKILLSINGVILKLLENFNTTNSIVALIKIISNYKSEKEQNAKVCLLAIQCLSKLTKVIDEIINLLEVDKILYALWEFISEFEKISQNLSPRSENEEMSIKVLKILLNAIIKFTDTKIWPIYQNIIDTYKCKDIQLKRWIQLILRSKNGMSQPIPQSNNKILSPKKNEGNITNNNILRSIHKEDHNESSNNMNRIKNELLQFAERLNSIPMVNDKERDKVIYEIILLLNQNKLNVEYMADKLNENSYTSLLKIYHSIHDSNSEVSKINSINLKPQINFNTFNTVSTFDEKENANNIIQRPTQPSNNFNNTNNQQSFQIKRLQEYRNKLYGLNNKGNNCLNSNQSITTGDFLRERREMLREVQSNANNNRPINSLNSINMSSFSTNQINNFNSRGDNRNDTGDQTDRLSEMKKKLQILRQQKF